MVFLGKTRGQLLTEGSSSSPNGPRESSAPRQDSQWVPPLSFCLFVPLSLKLRLQGLQLCIIPLLQARQAAALELQQAVDIVQVAAQGLGVLFLRFLQVCGQRLWRLRRVMGEPWGPLPPAPHSPR